MINDKAISNILTLMQPTDKMQKGLKRAKVMRVEDVRQRIDEYIGKHFRFLVNYIDGGYEGYVKDNLKKITHKKVYGVERIRSEYKKIHSPYILEQQVLSDCEKTLGYVKS